MLLSDERISSLAHAIGRALMAGGLIETDDPDVMTQEIKRAMIQYVRGEAGIDQKARAKIATLKRGVLEGSHEWEILYQKYYEEELNKSIG